MTVIPGHGHFHPVVPLARALGQSGHEVRVATSASFAPTVERAGLSVERAGLDWVESRPELVSPGVDMGSPRARAAELMRIFNEVAPRAMVPDLLTLIESWRPDLLLFTLFELGGLLAAEMTDTPYVLLRNFIPAALGRSHAPGGGGSTEKPEWSALNTFRSELGLRTFDPRGEAFPALRYLDLDLVPPSLHLLAAQNPLGTAHPLRPVHFSVPALGGGSFSEDGFAGPGPRLLVSLGTVFNDATDVISAIVDGLSGVGRSLVVGLGNGTTGDVAPSADMRFAPWAPFDVVLPGCDVLVTHGGWGSMMAALSHGVPMLVLPQAADNFVNALRVRSIGAGRFLAPPQVTASAVREEAAILLSDPVYRLNALRLKDEIEAMPGPDAAVGLLERLARERAPVTSTMSFPRF